MTLTGWHKLNGVIIGVNANPYHQKTQKGFKAKGQIKPEISHYSRK